THFLVPMSASRFPGPSQTWAFATQVNAQGTTLRYLPCESTVSIKSMDYPDYPFTPRRFEVRPGIAMSYLDEGPRDGEVVVMVHGNPSWSYYWRHLVLGLRDRYRCIVPDHVGMGLSDKLDDGGGVRPPADPAGARYD